MLPETVGVDASRPGAGGSGVRPRIIFWHVDNHCEAIQICANLCARGSERDGRCLGSPGSGAFSSPSLGRVVTGWVSPAVSVARCWVGFPRPPPHCERSGQPAGRKIAPRLHRQPGPGARQWDDSGAGKRRDDGKDHHRPGWGPASFHWRWQPGAHLGCSAPPGQRESAVRRARALHGVRASVRWWVASGSKSRIGWLVVVFAVVHTPGKRLRLLLRHPAARVARKCVAPLCPLRT